MDSNTREGSDLSTGLDAFREALKPQEGQFMRGATWIMNDPKDLSGKPSRADTVAVTDNSSIAGKLLERSADGRFVKKDSAK